MAIDLQQIPRPRSRQPVPPNAQKVFVGEVFSIIQWQQKMYDESYETFEKLQRSDSVGVLAVTSERKIIVTKQEQPSMQPFYSLLGGVIDPGETPIESAQRELKEEAGAESQEWQLWFSSQPMSKIDWAIYMFIAKNVVISHPQSLDAGERIELLFLTFDEFIEIIQLEEFRDFEVALKVLRMIQQGKKVALESLLFDN